jgi:hypothetical protein
MDVFTLIRRLPGRALRARLSRAALDRHYRRAIADAPTRERRESLEHEWRFESEMAYEEDAKEYTKKLLRRAGGLRVPTPPLNDGEDTNAASWRRSNIDGERYLTRVGIARVREAIRAEEKAQREARTHRLGWVPWLLTVISGLVALSARCPGRPPGP